MSATSTDPKFDRFEVAAKVVITCLQQIPDFASFRLLVVGGLAVQKHSRSRRNTKDIDFLITDPCAPSSPKERLRAYMPSLFKMYPSKFVFCGLTPFEIVINMIPPHQVPYIPISAPRISAIPPGVIPYVDAKDLFVIKTWSCGLRFTRELREKDAKDIKSLAAILVNHHPVTFSSEQMKAITEGRPDVIGKGNVTTQLLDRVTG